MNQKISNILRDIAINGALALTAVALTLCLGEILVRVFSPQQLTIQNNKLWVPDPFLGWKKTPLANEIINTGEQSVWISTDSPGFRINPQEPTNKNCAHSILFLGDSFLEALQVENEDAFPERLKHLLKEKKNLEYCAVNTGVGGWGPAQYYLQAKLELEKRKYDLVVVSIFVGNDFMSSFDTIIPPRQPIKKHPLRLPVSLDSKELQLALWRPIKNHLSARSHLFVLLKNSLEYYSSKSPEGEYIQPVFLKDNKNGLFWETTVSACNHIQALASRKNTPILFCLMPTNYQVQEDLLANYLNASGIDPNSVDMGQPSEVFGKRMRENNMLLIDPLPYLRDKGKSGPNFGEVDRHFNEKGHLCVSEFIYPILDSILTATQ